MELEWLATGVVECGAYPFEWNEVPAGRSGKQRLSSTHVRSSGRWQTMLAGRDFGGAVISRRFHSTMVELVGSVCDHIRRLMRLDAVVLSGGVFMNALLSSEAGTRLSRDGFRVFRHRLVPPNDGGLSLGQLAVAAALAEREAAGETAARVGLAPLGDE